MLSTNFLLSTLFLLGYTLACDFNADYNTTLCTSLDSAFRQGREDWNILKIKNYGNQTLGPLQSNSLRRSPNLSQLNLYGVVNRIHRDALKKLTKLQSLELFNNDVNSLPRDIFQGLKLENIYIVNSGLNVLHEGTFQRLEKLRVLFIRNNSLQKIPRDVFSESNIEDLILENNGIQTIDDFAFINMPKLTKLSLNDNHLKQFSVRLLFGSSTPKLDKLWLNKNNISTIEQNMFLDLPKLRYLFLEGNQITTIQHGAFNNLDNLVVLDISNNQLTTISTNIFPPNGAQKLEVFLLHSNQMTFLTSICEKLPSLKFISVFGNPLQCPCYLELTKYFGNKEIQRVCGRNELEKRPVCIYTKDNSQECIKDVQETRDLYFEYKKLTKDWEPWDTKCQFGDGYEGLKWSPYAKK